MHTHTESESYDHKLETLLGVTSTDGMSVGALGLRVGQERRDFPLDVVELGQSRLENQSHASAWDDKESPLPGLSKSCFDMADYKPVQDLPDEAVELLEEGSRSPNAMIDQPKVEIQEQDQDTTRQRLTASPSSSVINLANTVLGSGMLAMVSQILY